jgi:hypothetical protein
MGEVKSTYMQCCARNQIGVAAPARIGKKDCRHSLPREAEGTLGKYALMVKPTRALLYPKREPRLRSELHSDFGCFFI